MYLRVGAAGVRDIIAVKWHRVTKYSRVIRLVPLLKPAKLQLFVESQVLLESIVDPLYQHGVQT